MLRTWTTDRPDELVRCWELYIKGTKLSEPTDETDILPGDDALLLGCYTLVKAYVSTSNPFLETVFKSRAREIPLASSHLAGNRVNEE
jgi:hypothetical protein